MPLNRDEEWSLSPWGLSQSDLSKLAHSETALSASEYLTLELSTQMLIKEALQRNISVEVLDWREHFIRLKKGEKIEVIKQATKTSQDPYIAALIMENKAVTKQILRERGIDVPEGVTVYSEEEAAGKYSQFSQKDLVIKPKSTNFGKGVVILRQPYTAESYHLAVAHALKYDTAAMVEAFIPGPEYRFLVIGDAVVAVLSRVPANVTGDGIHTIAELVKEKNKDPLRGKGYVTPLEEVTLGEVEKAYLASQNKDFLYIPQRGETVYLRENSNISTGGDSIDVTDEVMDAYKEIAVCAAQAVGAKICGADIIIQDIRKKPNHNNYSVIELNFNPALHIHDFPYQGKNRRVEKKVLDLLGF